MAGGPVVCVLALGLLIAALRGNPQAPGPGDLRLAPVLSGLSLAVAIILTFLLVGAALWLIRLSMGELSHPHGGDGTPPRVYEEPEAPLAVKLLLLALLAAVVAFFVWLLTRPGPAENPMTEPGGIPPVADWIGPIGNTVPGGLVRVVSQAFAAAAGFAALAAMVALGVMAFSARRRWPASVSVTVKPHPSAGRGAAPATRVERVPLAVPGSAAWDALVSAWDALDPAAAVSAVYQTFVDALSARGVRAADPARPGRRASRETTTPREFTRAVTAAYPPLAGDAGTLTSIYERCRYGLRPVALEDYHLARSGYLRIARYLGSLAEAGEKKEGDRAGEPL